MKLKTYLTAGLLTLGAPMAAQAALQFDTQGNGTFQGQAGPVINIDGFDWAQNSFLADGGVQAIVNFANDDCANGGCDFVVYTHGVLNSATLDGAPIWGGKTFGDNQVEVTFTLSFTETVTQAGGTFETSEFDINTAEAINFEMYYDTTPDSDVVSGSGYSDGTLILFGNEITDSQGVFQITQDFEAPPEDLDQSGSNDFDGQLTVEGNGSQGNIELGGLQQDNTYFKSALSAFGFDFSNLSFEIPFTTVSPSDCFNGTSNANGGANVGTEIGTNGCNTAHTDGTFEQNEAGATGLVPTTGTINGFPAGTYNQEQCTPTSCPDFVAQTDANSAVQVDVPEPGTLAITGLGLLLLGARRRRNKV